jgi:hypothetical protein
VVAGRIRVRSCNPTYPSGWPSGTVLASPFTAHSVRIEVRRNSGKRKGIERHELFKGGKGK